MPEGLQFGFPVRSDGTAWTVVEGIEHDDFAQEKIAATTEELVDERERCARSGCWGADHGAVVVVGVLAARRLAGRAARSVRRRRDLLGGADPASTGRRRARRRRVPPPRSLLEVRADGLWAELVCEIPGEHWGFGLEAFGLRSTNRRCARSERAERCPWASTSSGRHPTT